MSPLALAEKKDKMEYEKSEHKAVEALCRELEVGIQSMKAGDVYTVKEVWGELGEI